MLCSHKPWFGSSLCDKLPDTFSAYKEGDHQTTTAVWQWQQRARRCHKMGFYKSVRHTPHCWTTQVHKPTKEKSGSVNEHIKPGCSIVLKIPRRHSVVTDILKASNKMSTLLTWFWYCDVSPASVSSGWLIYVPNELKSSAWVWTKAHTSVTIDFFLVSHVTSSFVSCECRYLFLYCKYRYCVKSCRQYNIYKYF